MTKKYEVWLADLNPRYGSEPGKIRPVVVVQGDFINGRIRSTMICPITSKIVSGTSVMRLRIQQGEGGMTEESDILVSQIRAIDNSRFVRKLGSLHAVNRDLLDENLAIVLDLG